LSLQVTTKVRYGMRAMIELALNMKEWPVTISYLAEKQELSVKYLESLMSSLKNAGLVLSKRGSGGGYVLSRTVAEITAKDIYLALEGPVNIVGCVENYDYCEKVQCCYTYDLWRDLNETINSKLANISLKELVEKAKEKNVLED